MSKVNMRRLAFVVCFVLLFLFVRVSYSVEPVVIEFLYYEPTCPACPSAQENYEIYLHNSQVVDDIQRDYGSKVSVEQIWFFSEEGRKKIDQYGINLTDWNAIVINYEVAVTGYADEARLREIVDSYLTVHDVAILSVVPASNRVYVGESLAINVTVSNKGDEVESFDVTIYCNSSIIGTHFVEGLEPAVVNVLVFHWETRDFAEGEYLISAQVISLQNETDVGDNWHYYGIVEVRATSVAMLIPMLALAFSFGFFETFSPCLIILLSFVLSYTLGKESHFRESFLKVMIFGIGFVFAALLLGVAFGLFFLSTPTLQFSLTWGVCVFAVFFGLNLLGLLQTPFQTKPLIRKLARKYVITYAGLFLLGFIFYFLDPCIAPIFVSMMPLLLSEVLPLIFFMFCLGAFIPFIGIGIFAGSVSKLARITYRQRFKIRAVSGLILIGYALYLIILYLLPKLEIFL